MHIGASTWRTGAGVRVIAGAVADGVSSSSSVLADSIDGRSGAISVPWRVSTTVSSTPVSKRPRIVYQVTDAGHREFERLMSEVGPTAWEDDNFDIRFAFFGRTDMEIRLRVLEGRRTRLQERLDRVQQQLAMTQKEVDRYAAELQRHGVESVEREVRWLSDLINAERGSSQAPESTAHSESETRPA